MASIQPKTVKGKRYWQIVQSRRINGKPRPVVLEHLGTADTLLKKLKARKNMTFSVKSYSHGLTALLLKTAAKLDVVQIINNEVKAQRAYFSEKPIRNNFTVGATLLLAAVGRICHPTSKQGWFSWAKKTSFSFLLRMNLSNLDSQHFWDMMDSLPVEKISTVEKNILSKVKENYGLEPDTLFYDTTNFYTYIHTTNIRCTIARRGKNKQKRCDLRQVGLAMVVSRKDLVPLFHEAYQGNRNDSHIFKKLISKIKIRMQELNLCTDVHTVVFDRGCNAKKNLKIISELNMHYIGALTPSYHKSLIRDAKKYFEKTEGNSPEMSVYRDKRNIWGEQRTVLVYISSRLKEGQERDLHKKTEKRLEQLNELNQKLSKPRTKKYTRKTLISKIEDIIAMPGNIPSLINYEVKKHRNGPYCINVSKKEDKIKALEKTFGYRIIMTSRHSWSSDEILKGYFGQSMVEDAFKNIKNPFYMAVTPEFHWTDQKIRIHFFICVMGYMLAAVLLKKSKEAGFNLSINKMLNILNNIRLAAFLENKDKGNNPEINYQLEMMDDEEEKLFRALGGMDIHKKKVKIKGVSLYK